MYSLAPKRHESQIRVVISPNAIFCPKLPSHHHEDTDNEHGGENEKPAVRAVNPEQVG